MTGVGEKNPVCALQRHGRGRMHGESGGAARRLGVGGRARCSVIEEGCRMGCACGPATCQRVPQHTWAAAALLGYCSAAQARATSAGGGRRGHREGAAVGSVGDSRTTLTSARHSPQTLRRSPGSHCAAGGGAPPRPNPHPQHSNTRASAAQQMDSSPPSSTSLMCSARRCAARTSPSKQGWRRIWGREGGSGGGEARSGADKGPHPASWGRAGACRVGAGRPRGCIQRAVRGMPSPPPSLPPCFLPHPRLQPRPSRSRRCLPHLALHLACLHARRRVGQASQRSGHIHLTELALGAASKLLHHLQGCQTAGGRGQGSAGQRVGEASL